MSEHNTENTENPEVSTENVELTDHEHITENNDVEILQPDVEHTHVNDVPSQTDNPITTITKENKMAEMTNGWYDPSLHTEHAAIRHDVAVESARLATQIGAEACGIRAGQGDIRAEQAENFGHTRRDIQGTAADLSRQMGDGFCKTDNTVMQEGQAAISATKDARFDIAERITNSGDRVSDRMMELRGLVGQRFHEVSHDLATVKQGQATLAKDVELNALKTQIEGQKNTQYLSDKITIDGEKTRGLINDLKYHDLNRSLVERNAELVECEADRRHWRHRADQSQYGAQWAQLQSQVQAFQSQLQETRQGLVNFGTMAGNAGQQSSTSNNVK